MSDLLPIQSLHWLQRSIAVHGGRGSAGYYHLWRGWSAAYPETTGYIIETLWDYYHRSGDETLSRDALSCTDWLCDIQLPNGAWRGGIGGALPPIVFDTGMILFGLTRSFVETGEGRYLEAARSGLQWLLKVLDPDGVWRRGAYVPGYTPRYYTRVVWAALYVNRYAGLPGVEERMQAVLAGLESFEGAPAFRVGEPAFTHTIAYTWRGFLESALLLGHQSLIEQTAALMRHLMTLREEHGSLAGAYDASWNGDYSFSCVTGNAQLSVLMHRLYTITGEAAFRESGALLLEDAAAAVWLCGAPGLRGGVPGSRPLWGKYQPYRFPNWAAKFLLDAFYIAAASRAA